MYDPHTSPALGHEGFGGAGGGIPRAFQRFVLPMPSGHLLTVRSDIHLHSLHVQGFGARLRNWGTFLETMAQGCSILI